MNTQHLPSGQPGANRAWLAALVDAEPDAHAHAHARALWQQAVHDLRGKLGVVSNATALLRRPCSDARRAELTAVLDRNVAGLRDLLNGVADLARLEARPERPALRMIDVAASLERACSDLQGLAGSRAVQLEFRGPANLVAQSDPLMLARIAQNLLLNAIQYSRAGGIVLACGCGQAGEADHWYFEIGDAAASSSRSSCAQPHLAQEALAEAGPCAGEGIGLAIVDRLCGLLGGASEVSRDDHGGRATRVKLPMRYAAGDPHALKTSTVAGRATHS